MNNYVIIVGVNPAEIVTPKQLADAYRDVGGPHPETDITVYWQPEGDYELRALIQETAFVSADDQAEYLITKLSVRGGQEVAEIRWDRKK